MAVAPSRHAKLKLQGWEAHTCVNLVGHKPSDFRALPRPEAKPNHGSHPPRPSPARGVALLPSWLAPLPGFIFLHGVLYVVLIHLKC